MRVGRRAVREWLGEVTGWCDRWGDQVSWRCIEEWSHTRAARAKRTWCPAGSQPPIDVVAGDSRPATPRPPIGPAHSQWRPPIGPRSQAGSWCLAQCTAPTRQTLGGGRGLVQRCYSTPVVRARTSSTPFLDFLETFRTDKFRDITSESVCLLHFSLLLEGKDGRKGSSVLHCTAQQPRQACSYTGPLSCRPYCTTGPPEYRNTVIPARAVLHLGSIQGPKFTILRWKIVLVTPLVHCGVRTEPALKKSPQKYQ